MKSQKKKRIYSAPSARFNHDQQLQIDTIEWAREEVEINKFPNDGLESIIQATVSEDKNTFNM